MFFWDSIEWLVTLIKTITEGFNSIVDLLIFLHDKLVEYTMLLDLKYLKLGYRYSCPDTIPNCNLLPQDYLPPGAINPGTTLDVMLDWLGALKFVIGDYIFYFLILTNILMASIITFKMIRALKKMIWGDKGALESTGIMKWISKFFKKG